jgi:exodeoxyribonuclease V alpha subunit
MELSAKVPNAVNEAAIDREFVWDDTQLVAIKRCCNMQERIVPVTGVAGSGKTTIIREVFMKLANAGYRVALAAPTGKAAKRIQEATGLPAMTLHRLLEYPHPGERDVKTGAALSSTVPKRDRKNPLNYDVILADEYAMVNREVHRNLIDALPKGGRICMFGDVNQLSPIEQGKFTNKLSPFQTALQKFDGTVLKTIHRTVEGSGIAFNGDRILKGQVPLRRDDFIMKVTDTPVDALIDIVMDYLMHKNVSFGTNQGQIITASKKSWIGTYKLNVALQEMLNPIGMHMRLKVKRHTWDSELPISVGVGDKIIWTENSYDLRNEWDRWDEDDQWIATPPEKTIMNGESGVVTDISKDEMISIDLGDRIVEVPKAQTVLNKKGDMATINPHRTIDLGFAITTHKSQGSEWPHVIYVLNKTTSFIQSRHNFYTAISRARTTATVIADQRSLQNSVLNAISAIERKQSNG